MGECANEAWMPKGKFNNKKWLINNVHVCQPDDQLKIDDLVSSLGYMNDTANTGYLLYEKMASFTGTKNLSLDIPSSALRSIMVSTAYRKHKKILHL